MLYLRENHISIINHIFWTICFLYELKTLIKTESFLTYLQITYLYVFLRNKKRFVI